MPIIAPGSLVTGSDASGRLVVGVDQADRVRSVELSGLDERLREPGQLDHAVLQAAPAARVARLDQRARPPGAHPREARRPERRRTPILDHQALGLPITLPDFEAARRLRRAAADAVSGTSGNECVTVHLGPGSAHGHVVADPGWLATATASKVAAAVSEAFADAYEKRDDMRETS